MSAPVYEMRGDYDNSRERDGLIFKQEGRRVALFKSHDPDRIGVAVDQPDDSVICWSITPEQLIEALERTRTES